MGTEWSSHSAAILASWIERLTSHRCLMGHREAVAAQLDGWLGFLGDARDGDQAAAPELLKLVALHARQLGYDGRPASAALWQIVDLEAALIGVLGRVPDPLREVVREMQRVAVDAHSLGHGERIQAKHDQQIRDFSPILRIGGDTVVAFALGPMTGSAIDAIAGRLMRECAIVGARVAVLDVAGAEEDNDRFRRTMDDLLKSEQGAELSLVLTGLRDPGATRAALESLGTDLSRLRTERDLSDYLRHR